jgi:hypothetical protein
MNTALATGDVPLGEGFLAWRDWANKNPVMQIGEVMGRSCLHLTPQECTSYDAGSTYVLAVETPFSSRGPRAI